MPATVQITRFVWIVAAGLCALTSSEDGDAAEPRRNILFIAVDDLRPELGCYGSPMVKSPNIDRLAASGLQFNRAYCQFALCNPSRASLLSGRRPETIQVFTLARFVRDGNPDVVTLPQFFKERGYESRSYGKIFHAGNGNHDDPISWTVPPWRNANDDEPSDTAPQAAPKKSKKKKASPAEPAPDPHANEKPYSAPDAGDEALVDGQIATKAIQALSELRDKPFFLGVGFIRPHLPFVAPKKYWDIYDPSRLRLASNPFLPKGAPAFASNDSSELRRYLDVPKEGPISDSEALKLIQGYFACVSYVDAQVGRVLAELDRLGLRENTIVILWGDHGYQLGEHGTWTKRTNWEIATRVPMILSVPGMKPGSKTDALVEFVDIYPTLVELCGFPMPAGLEGTSMVPLLKDPDRHWKTAAFSFYTNATTEMGRTNGRAMRTERYRLVEWSGTTATNLVYELYDHETDPDENVNLAVLPEHRTLVERLKKQLQVGWQGARVAAN